MNIAFRRGVCAMLFTILSAPAWAEVTVTDAWVRGTVASQKVTGGFFTIESAKGGAIVGVESPAAARVELHEMRMEGDVARMRQIERLPLPTGEPLELRPGGYHLMLFGLKQPLADGDSVPLQLQIDAGDGQVKTIAVQATVRGLGGGAPHHAAH